MRSNFPASSVHDAVNFLFPISYSQIPFAPYCSYALLPILSIPNTPLPLRVQLHNSPFVALHRLFGLAALSSFRRSQLAVLSSLSQTLRAILMHARSSTFRSRTSPFLVWAYDRIGRIVNQDCQYPGNWKVSTMGVLEVRQPQKVND